MIARLLPYLRDRLPRAAATAIHPALGRDFAAGMVTASVAIAYYISAAALLFPGPLAPHISVALGAALFGGAVLAAVNAWKGSLPLTAAGAEPVTVPVLAGVTAAIASNPNLNAALPTAYAAIILSSLAIGGVWWGLGARRLGRWIRFIPYPVIGGFLASVGALLVTGSLSLLEGHAMNMAGLWQVLSTGPSLLSACGLACGLGVWFANRHLKHPLVLPLGLLSLCVLIHLGMALSGTSLVAATQSAWLLSVQSAWPTLPLDWEIWAAVDYAQLWAHADSLLAAVIVSVLGLLLSNTSLEVAFDAESDLDGDLRVLGWANIASAIGGGLGGGISVSRSLLNTQAGAVGRNSGYFQAGLCVLVMIGGAPLIALIPVPVLGGLLLYMGIGLIQNWLIAGRKTLSRKDYFTVVSIVLCTLTVGFVSAIFLGTLIACVSFAINAAKLGILHPPKHGEAWLSDADHGVLSAHAHKLQVVQLQGFLFFGSVPALNESLHAKLKKAEAERGHLIFDFSAVHGLDSSAAQALARIFKQLRAASAGFSLSGLNADHAKILARHAVAQDVQAHHPALDQAIAAWKEDCLSAAT